MAQIIKGAEVAKQIREELKVEIDNLKAKGIIPGLATVLVGDDPASHSYVKSKRETCAQLGIESFHHHLDKDTPEKDILDLVDKLNNDSRVHGILVQLPLPKHVDTNKILLAISPSKDVDGFHPTNIGKMNARKSRAEIDKDEIFLPCTPSGCIELIKRSGTKISGSEAVVLGRSNIVGKPVAMLLLADNATVTICHSATKNLTEVIKRADILVAAVGIPKMVKGDMVKEGVVVIDVGVNRIGMTPEGKAILVGDVDFDEVSKKASVITPVPGGVGPMTITMLMVNTVKAAKLKSV